MAEDCLEGFRFVETADVENDVMVRKATETLFRETAPTHEKGAVEVEQSWDSGAKFDGADEFHFAESFDLMM